MQSCCQRAVPGSAPPLALVVPVKAGIVSRVNCGVRLSYFEPKPVSIVQMVFAVMKASSEGETFLM